MNRPISESSSEDSDGEHEQSQPQERVHNTFDSPGQATDQIECPAPEITQNSKFFPFFKQAIGAMNGCHIPVSLPASDSSHYRNQKKFLSQTVLAVYNFDMTFSNVIAGWEGSATDSRVFNESITTGSITIPDNRYLIADAGYSLSTRVLTPYRGVRYHLKEWSKGRDKPMNCQELFNLRHP
jgi:hypothetical protein